MKCTNPQHIERLKMTVPCRSCTSCRVNAKREFVGRMILEQWSANVSGTFLTLTYNDESLPSDNLVPQDLTKFLKRVRNNGLGKIRYVAVGEYGDKSWRPHFHLILFGLPNTRANNEYLDKCWNNGFQRGFTYGGDVTSASMYYVANYCMKKMTSGKDAKLQDAGLTQPEFFRASRKPVIGYRGLLAIADWLTTEKGSIQLARWGIPAYFKINKTLYPLRYSDRVRIMNMLDIPDYCLYEVTANQQAENWANLREVQGRLIQIMAGQTSHSSKAEEAAEITNLDRREHEIIEKIEETEREARADYYLKKGVTLSKDTPKREI